jgi:colicin import membrane protein
LEFGRRVDSEAKRLTGLIEPIEKHLEDQESIVEREKERLRQIEEHNKRERLQQRLDRLAKVGAMRDPVLVGSMSDAGFAELMAEAEREFEAKLKREADEAAERERQAELLRVERERIEAERKRQDEERRQLQEEQAKIDAERRKVEAEKQRVEQEERLRLAKIEAEKAAIERAKVEAELKEKAEQKRLADERERLAAEEALKPDVQKLVDFANAIDALPMPTLKTKKAGTFAASIKLEIAEFCNKIRSFK